MSSLRFPPPWSVEETAACFIVRDANIAKLRLTGEEPGGGRVALADCEAIFRAQETTSA
jgi:hypothetical protein